MDVKMQITSVRVVFLESYGVTKNILTFYKTFTDVVSLL